MNDGKDRAWAYFAEHVDHREFVLYTESLRLGRADVLFAGAAGVLMHLRHTRSYLVAALTTRDARTVLTALPPAGSVDLAAGVGPVADAGLAAGAGTDGVGPVAGVGIEADGEGPAIRTGLVTGAETAADAAPAGGAGPVMASTDVAAAESHVFMFSDERIARELGFDDDHCEPYYFYMYDHAEPFALRDGLVIRRLAPVDAPVVASHYALLSPEDIRRHLAAGWVWGGYTEQGDLAGFIGEHDEATMGMLEVFPEFRRRGYARELQGASINRLLAAGRVPCSQVALDNEASMALQRSTGMTRVTTVHAWCWE